MGGDEDLSEFQILGAKGTVGKITTEASTVTARRPSPQVRGKNIHSSNEIENAPYGQVARGESLAGCTNDETIEGTAETGVILREGSAGRMRRPSGAVGEGRAVVGVTWRRERALKNCFL